MYWDIKVISSTCLNHFHHQWSKKKNFFFSERSHFLQKHKLEGHFCQFPRRTLNSGINPVLVSVCWAWLESAEMKSVASPSSVEALRNGSDGIASALSSSDQSRLLLATRPPRYFLLYLSLPSLPSLSLILSSLLQLEYWWHSSHFGQQWFFSVICELYWITLPCDNVLGWGTPFKTFS